MTGRDMICQLLKTKYKYSNIPHTLDHVLEIIAENMNVLDVWKEEQHLIELRDEIKQLERKLKVIKKSSPIRSWISVKSRLPDEDGEYLISMYHRFMIGGIYKKYTGRFIAEYYAEYKEWRIMNDVCTSVTHWMPLPQKPESEDDEE